MATDRLTSFGQTWTPTLADRLGEHLSARQISRFIDDMTNLKIADLGCGYHAKLSSRWLTKARRAYLVDLKIDPRLANDRVEIIQGALPKAAQAIPENELDLVLLNSVLEHLSDPEGMLREIYRCLAPGGTALLNVPSWRGKYWLELFAFRFGWSPAEEMDDHKRYYDVRDLWPLLVQAGFLPSRIRCFSHKFGMNTFAAVKK